MNLKISRGTYRRYPQEVKKAVIQSKNPNLFPQLKIPRTTALSWIYSDTHPQEDVLSDEVFHNKIKQLEYELKKEKALRILIQKAKNIFPYDFKKKRVKNKNKKEQIVHLLKETLKYHRLNTCLNSIGLSKSTYLRWNSEINRCKHTGFRCKKRTYNQLTDQEIMTMWHFVTSSKYSHFPLYSLHLHAQNLGQLFCSLDTWNKYISFYGWKRPKNHTKPKKKYKGLKTSQPNEVWHMDITQVKLPSGETAYIQSIIDNYSRYVLCHSVHLEVDAQITLKNLKNAKKNAFQLLSPQNTKLLVDGGTENVNSTVTGYIKTCKNLRRLIARTEIRYSNSRVEALFRSLKCNYLYHEKIKSLDALKRKVNFYFNQHNHIIPHSAFKGATPNDIFTYSWTETSEVQLRTNRKKAFQSRVKSNTIKPCNSCVTFVREQA